MNGATSTREEVLREIREAGKLVCTTHENPDGDAIGSLAAMALILGALGKDALCFMPEHEFPLPYEYRFIRLEGLATQPPDDLC